VVQIGKNVQRILPLGEEGHIIVCGVFELNYRYLFILSILTAGGDEQQRFMSFRGLDERTVEDQRILGRNPVQDRHGRKSIKGLLPVRFAGIEPEVAATGQD
jgi:hypothetical protein